MDVVIGLAIFFGFIAIVRSFAIKAQKLKAEEEAAKWKQ